MNDNERLQLEPLPRVRRAVKTCGLFAPGKVIFARAPGRLDVMGGIADYSGSLVCEMPLAIAAGVAVQARGDAKIVCRSGQEPNVVTLPAEALKEKDPLSLRNRLQGAESWARYPIGCAWWLAQRGTKIAGLTIFMDSDVPLGGGVSSSAAVEVATMTALCRLLGVTLSPLELAVACQAVENHVVGAPCGVMDQVTSSMGDAGSMLEILCQAGADGLPAQVLGQVHVLKGYAFVGIHSGVRHEVSGDPYTDTRVAAFMGQKILSTLESPDLTRGHLALVDVQRYQRELRAKLPEAMTGRAFLDQFKSSNDSVTTIKQETTYTVRAATDHHVMEMSRVQRFVELLKRAAGPMEKSAAFELMKQAGALMVESHHSYGDCAHMGHAMTDRLVALVDAQGVAAGLLGAKITGGGCGGTVAVLMVDDDETRASLAAIRERYARETGRQTMYFEGSGPGAAAWGVVDTRYEDLL